LTAVNQTRHELQKIHPTFYMRNFLLCSLLTICIITTDAQTTTYGVEVYGNLMTDIGYDLDQSNPDWFDVVRPTQLPSYENEYGTNGNAFFSVRQTRLGLKTFTPTKRSVINGRFEMDLFGVGTNKGETTFHLRHAFVEWGRLGVGQTWSPFIDAGAAPMTLDYWGPIGMVLYRNIQLRYTAINNPHHLLQVALERPGASADEGIYASRIELSQVNPEFSYPDISTAYKFGFSSGYLRIAGIFRHIAWKDQLDDNYELSGSANGWGINFSTKISINKQNWLMGQVIYGKGIESCMNDAPYDIGIRVIGDSLSNRPIEGYALPVFGYFAGLEHHWGAQLRSTASYSWTNISNAKTSLPQNFRQGRYALLNLLYFPNEKVMVGVELQWAQRLNEEEVDGFLKAQQRRVQLSFKYSFDHKLKTN
jgi:hypothetical protein